MSRCLRWHHVVFGRLPSPSQILGLLLLILGQCLATGLSVAAAQDDVEADQRLDGQIVFEAYADENWDLYVVSAEGGEPRKLTDTPALHELYPQVSPDGSAIAFLCDSDREGANVRRLEWMRLDGSARTVIEEGAREPTWSPDGRSIAFAKQEFERFNVTDYVSKGLRIHHLATGETRDAGNSSIHHIYNPNYSPDGRWIVATVHGGMGFRHGIIAIEMDGDRVIDLKIPGCRPALTNDGRRIVWSSDDHTIQVAELEWSEDGVQLLNPRIVHQEEKLHTYHPEPSPDGSHVVFSLGPGGRVLADSPGTHTQVAEMIGVRGKWNLVIKKIDQAGPLRFLTSGSDATSKEADWFVAQEEKSR